MDSCSKRDYSDMLNKVNSNPYFAVRSGVKVTAIHDDHSAEGELEIRTDTQNPLGILHGGALFTLADTVAGVAAFTTGRSCVTLDSSMQFLTAAKGEKVFCVAAPKKMGRTILVYDVSIADDGGRLVATGVFTFYAVGEYTPHEKH